MAASFVIDASVAAKLRFLEADSEKAMAIVEAADAVVAPAFLHLEMASVASKYARRRLASSELSFAAVASIGELLDEAVPSAELSRRAFQLALDHGFSAYDGAYVALAEARQLQLLTADTRLARRAREAGLGSRVRLLDEPK
ncbi:MAG: type II toxin-antitoxin system VapC family toxin [Caulobacteraceae bacterium]